MEESAADDDEVISFPVGKTASTGLPLSTKASRPTAHTAVWILPDLSMCPKQPPFIPTIPHHSCAGTPGNLLGRVAR